MAPHAIGSHFARDILISQDRKDLVVSPRQPLLNRPAAPPQQGGPPQEWCAAHVVGAPEGGRRASAAAHHQQAVDRSGNCAFYPAAD
jgi:hypothetical protein